MEKMKKSVNFAIMMNLNAYRIRNVFLRNGTVMVSRIALMEVMRQIAMMMSKARKTYEYFMTILKIIAIRPQLIIMIRTVIKSSQRAMLCCRSSLILIQLLVNHRRTHQVCVLISSFSPDLFLYVLNK